MFIYLSVFVALSTISLISISRQSIHDKRFLGFVSCMIVISFQSLRWRTGTDWIPYYEAFVNCIDYRIDYVEYGYYFLNRIIRSVSDSYTIYLVIQCSLGVFCTVKFAKWANVQDYSTIILSYFANTIFPIRLTLAVSIFSLAYKYIEQKKFLRFLMITLIAASVHSAVYIVIPVYFFVRNQFKYRTLCLLYIAACIIGLGSTIIFDKVFNISAALWSYMGDFGQNKMNSYVNADNIADASFWKSITSYINGLLFISLFSYIRNKYYSNSSCYNIMLNMYVLGLIINRLIIHTIPYFSRVVSLFSCGFAIMIVMGIYKQQKKYRWLLGVLYIIYIFLIYNRQINGAYQDLFIPYYSIFSTQQRFYVY